MKRAILKDSKKLVIEDVPKPIIENDKYKGLVKGENPEFDKVFQALEKEKKKHFPSHGNIELIHEGNNMWHQGSMRIKPHVGDFIIFPSYLLHTVYPFKGDVRTVKKLLVMIRE